jgi:hypothetical protein
VASFLSFTSATDPVHSKDISLSVGFLGTLATILTALQAAYKFDTMAETFRSASLEYRLLTTRVNRRSLRGRGRRKFSPLPHLLPPTAPPPLPPSPRHTECTGQLPTPDCSLDGIF